MIDLLLGGSPCQGFSFAGKQLNFFDPRSKLFFDYVKALEILKSKYFLLENVKMEKEYEDVITQHLGVKPIEINSALVSAQNRVRLYWTNIPGVKQPEDKGILLKDIIDDGFVKKEKSWCMLESWNRFPKSTESAIGRYNRCMMPVVFKTPDFDFYKGWRELNISECEKLQTIPVGYTSVVNEKIAKGLLGNGWTVDVIAHILSFIPETYLHTVVSLFDGISCGQVALERAGKIYNQYYASEIDKDAIAVTQKNYPHTMQLGDVTKIDWNAFLDRLNLIQKVS
jgi:hypothetical protein